ncbi:MAG: C/D box methylation guide ribonucleoprotein complex aNOP56 subunit, partial [Candidatus Gerdarchaeota archaeon]
SVAARLDYFEAGDKSLELVEETNKRINEIISKYPEPPKGKKQKQSAGQQYPKHKKPRHKGQKKRQ